MPQFALITFLGLIFLNLPVLAERPTIPARGPDTDLVGNSARDFFAARARNVPCRTNLTNTRAAFRREREALRRLVAARATAREIDAQEVVMKRARQAMLVPFAECGECANREIRPNPIRVVTPARTETWYVSDGSCQIETADRDRLRAAFTAIADSLLDFNQYQSRYPRKTQGISHLAQFVEVNHANGDFLEPRRVDASPFYAFIVVRGPNLPVQPLMSYYVRNEYARNAGDLHLTFQNARPAFTVPALTDRTAGGASLFVLPRNITSVIGSWYVTDDGYLRYFTAADFGTPQPLAISSANEISLTTLDEVRERGELAP